MTKVYCPAHGDWVTLYDDDQTFEKIGPGEIRRKCPECESEWLIQIEYRPM